MILKLCLTIATSLFLARLARFTVKPTPEPQDTDRQPQCITLECNAASGALLRYLQSRLPGDSPARVYSKAIDLLDVYVEAADSGLQVVIIDPDRPDKPARPIVLSLVDGLEPIEE